MATITIRNTDDKLVEHLKERAEQHHRSLESEVRQILADSAEKMTRDEFIQLSNRLRVMTPKGPQTDSAVLIREDRDTDRGHDS
jgi:plasmid stability protein